MDRKALAGPRVWGGLAAAMVVLPAAWLYAPTVLQMIRQWGEDENYSHGYLVPVLSAFLVWQRRASLKALPVRPVAGGLVVLVAGVGLALLGHLGAELFVTRMSLLVTIAGLVLYLLGWEHLRLLAFPIAYLVFMIPVPAIVFNAITFPLQSVATSVATWMLQGVGVPVLREGNVISLPHATLEVAEACSGIRSLVTLLALGAAYGYFTQRTAWRRVVLFVSAVPIAIVANAVRIAGTGLLAQWFGAQAAEGFFHTFSGWLVFAAAFVLMLAMAAVLGRIPARSKTEAAPAAGTETGRAWAGPGWRGVAVASGILVAGVVALGPLSRGEAVPLRGSLDEFPLQMGELRGVDEGLEPAIIGKLGVTEFLMRKYTARGRAPLWLYVGFYESQRTGALIHSPKNCLPGNGWSIVRTEEIAFDPGGPSGGPVRVNRVIVAKGESRQIVLYWYQERGRVIASEYRGRFYMVWDSITRNRTDGALVRISAPVVGSEQETQREIVGFASETLPRLARLLPQ